MIKQPKLTDVVFAAMLSKQCCLSTWVYLFGKHMAPDLSKLQPSGHIITDSLPDAAIEPTKMTGALSRSLIEASREYVLFLPYILMVSLPQAPVDPVIQSRYLHGTPKELFYWELPRPLVDLGRRGVELQMQSQVIFGIRKEEWPQVENAAKGIMVLAPDGYSVWQVRLQPLKFIDPFACSSRPVGDVSELLVDAVGFVVETSTAACIYKPKNSIGGHPLDFSIHVTTSLCDPRIELFIQSLKAGLAPFDEIEKIHGWVSFSESDRWVADVEERCRDEISGGTTPENPGPREWF